VYDEFLPTLREPAFNHNQLVSSSEELERNLQILTKKLAVKEEEVSELKEKVAVMTQKDETKHVFQLYRSLIDRNNYVFIRTQKKYLNQAMKRINKEKYELLLKEDKVPNAMNILNRLKEKLPEQKILFEAWSNKLAVAEDVNVEEMVRKLLQEPLS
jgi:quinol monooxygenase YgiN